MQYKILRLNDVEKMTTFSRSTIYRLMKEGKFPKSINIAPNSVVWQEADIEKYITNCITKSRADLVFK